MNPSLIAIFLAKITSLQKLDYLISSIQLIFADQKVFESEIIFTKNIAIKLGFKKTVVEYLVGNFEKTGVEELKKKVIADFLMT